MAVIRLAMAAGGFLAMVVVLLMLPDWGRPAPAWVWRFLVVWCLAVPYWHFLEYRYLRDPGRPRRSGRTSSICKPCRGRCGSGSHWCSQCGCWPHPPSRALFTASEVGSAPMKVASSRRAKGWPGISPRVRPFRETVVPDGVST